MSLPVTLERHNQGVHKVVVAAAGTGYTPGNQTVTFGNSQAGAAYNAKGYAVVTAAGTVADVVVTDPGTGYTGAPTATIADGNADATLTASICQLWTANNTRYKITVACGVVFTPSGVPWSWLKCRNIAGTEVYWQNKIRVNGIDFDIVNHGKVDGGAEDASITFAATRDMSINVAGTAAVPTGDVPTVTGTVFTVKPSNSSLAVGTADHEYTINFDMGIDADCVVINGSLKNIHNDDTFDYDTLSRIALPAMWTPADKTFVRNRRPETDWSATASALVINGIEGTIIQDTGVAGDARYYADGVISLDAPSVAFRSGTTLSSGVQFRWRHGIGPWHAGESVAIPSICRTWGATVEECLGNIHDATFSHGDGVHVTLREDAHELALSTWIEDYWTVTLAKIVTAVNDTLAAGIPLKWVNIDEGWRGTVGDWDVRDASFHYPLPATDIPAFCAGATNAARMATFRAQIDAWHALGLKVQLYLMPGVEVGSAVESDNAAGANWLRDVNETAMAIAAGVQSYGGGDTSIQFPDPAGAAYVELLAKYATIVEELDVDAIKFDFTSTIANVLTSTNYIFPAIEPSELARQYFDDFVNAVKAVNPNIMVQGTSISLMHKMDAWRTNDLYNGGSSTTNTDALDSRERQRERNAYCLALAGGDRAIHGDFINGGGHSGGANGIGKTNLRSWAAWARMNKSQGVQLEIGYNPWSSVHTWTKGGNRGKAICAKALKG